MKKEKIPKTREQKRQQAWAAIGSMAGALIAAMFFNPPWRDNSMEGMMKKVAIEINKACPMYLDDITRFDSVSVPSAVAFDYYYTLDADMEQINMDTLRKYLPAQLISKIKHEPELARFRKEGVLFKYTYRNQDGNVVYEFTVTPLWYNN